MNTPILRIAQGLEIPIDAITQRGAFLGTPGSGKTYSAGKLAEEMLDAGAQVVILDPVGPWYGLRAAADGIGAGKPIVVFGGLHGDVPITHAQGALIADLICDRNLSAVVDVSGIEDEDDMWQFAADFGRRVFDRRKAKPSAMALFIEECQEFIPERPAKGQNDVLRMFRRISKIGRNHGFGVWLISQRPQEICKTVLNLTECLFAFQMQGSLEREAVARWIADKGERSDLVDVLPNLERGQAHVWSPRWLKVNQTYRIGKKQTFDASATPKFGSTHVEPKSLSAVDLTEIAKAMQIAADDTDPAGLKRRIEELELALKSRRVLDDDDAIEKAEKRGYQRAALEARAAFGPLAAAVRRFCHESQLLIPAEFEWNDGVLEEIDTFRQPILTDGDEDARENIPANTPHVSATSREPKTHSGKSLPIGEKTILTAIAQHRSGASREQLTVLTGYKRSSRDTYIQRLRQSGFVEIRGDNLIASPSGIQALGPHFEPLPTGKKLRVYWLDRLPEGEKKILTILIEAFPKQVDRNSIDSATGYKRSSRDTYLQRLVAKKLVRIGDGPGAVIASKELF